MSEHAPNDATSAASHSDVPESEADGDRAASTASSNARRTYTARFAGFVALFGILVAVGLVTFHPAAFVAAVVPLAFLLAGLLGNPAAPGGSIAVSRRVEPTEPRPAETVTVTLTVENRGERTVSDLRLVDGVPEELAVVDGTPRVGGSLSPGECWTVEYDLRARRGTHAFDPVVVRSRTVSGSMWAQESLSAEGERRLQCVDDAEEVPLDERATHFVGTLLSRTGGEGVEFHATREYRRGDPPSRIHWRELAKRGELSTITYRERQAAQVTIITDSRPRAQVSAAAGEPSGALLAAHATTILLRSFLDRGHYVGVAAPGVDPEPGRAFPCRRIDHGRGTDQERFALDLLDENAAQTREGGAVTNGSGGEPRLRTGSPATEPLETGFDLTIGEFTDDLTAWSTTDAQFVCVTPLLDGAIHGLCTRLDREGFHVVVVSPDVTTPTEESTPVSRRPDASTEPDGDRINSEPRPDGRSEGMAGRTLRVQRATRIQALRQQGCTVIDWDPTEPLAVCAENQTLPGA